ncbi:hypothetical protein [Microbacterium flavum]|uniref:Secreted protein n=1 Tax=Microbacterium flavum TaxID=415216 RepID=A0ABS5XV19_9MICO|nr:hypothetical protein [Microbacterium flavum]MBT8797796.1 hypothetical protein [Microbacterium flavum]
MSTFALDVFFAARFAVTGRPGCATALAGSMDLEVWTARSSGTTIVTSASSERRPEVCVSASVVATFVSVVPFSAYGSGSRAVTSMVTTPVVPPGRPVPPLAVGMVTSTLTL